MTKEPFALCVFCGSSDQVHPAYKKLAHDTGAAIARAGASLVYGGGRIGLMGAAADGALAAGGTVIGVIPKFLEIREIAHAHLAALHVTETMHERQSLMNSLSDAFLILPGGFGTLAEFFEILTWRQIGLHQKPIALVNVEGFWDPLLHMLARAGAEHFIHGQDQAQFSVYPGPQAAINALLAVKAAN